MGTAFILAPLLVTADLLLSQMVFVPLHFLFAVAFLFLWVLSLWGYTTVCATLGDCLSYLNATSCWCSRTSKNSSDLVQCFNQSVGLCKWTEFGKCGWPYNPNIYARVRPRRRRRRRGGLHARTHARTHAARERVCVSMWVFVCLCVYVCFVDVMAACGV